MPEIKIPTMNARIKKMATYFGVDSQRYKTMEEYIDQYVDEEFIVRENGHIVRIKNTEESRSLEKLFGRSTSQDEYILKSPADVLKKELNDLRKEYKDDDSYIQKNPELEDLFNKGVSNSKIIKDPKIEQWLKAQDAMIAKDLADYKTLRSEIYQVRDNKLKILDRYVYESLQTKAQDLIDDLSNSKKTSWIRRARVVVDEYIEAFNKQEAERQEARKMK